MKIELCSKSWCDKVSVRVQYLALVLLIFLGVPRPDFRIGIRSRVPKTLFYPKNNSTPPLVLVFEGPRPDGG